MEISHGDLGFLPQALVLLAAAVISVPVARRLGLSAIVAYLVSGVVIGPFVFGVFRTPEAVIPVSELGIVLLLFLIGLELKFDRLLAMRRSILGLGAAQLAGTTVAVSAIAYMAGFLGARGALIAGLALSLSATAIALQILEERGTLQQSYGQRAFAILLFQDMAVVPLLALLPLLSPYGGAHTSTLMESLLSVVRVAGAIAIVVVAGRYLLNPFFRLLAQTGSREVMTAAALLVVLSAALLLQAAGMSMALGAFLAGVLLAESSYRHELEADIEPFRGLLLALFFMGVGMSIDLTVVIANGWLILFSALFLTVIKAVIVWLVFAPTAERSADSFRAGSVLTAAGEFAFVLLPIGGSLGVLSMSDVSLLTAIAAATMLIGPPFAAATDFVLRRWEESEQREADDFSDVHGAVLIVGFGRFGQIVAQCLLAEDIDVTAIDNDAEMIQSAGRFGFKVYYGDGARLDVLRAAGGDRVRLIAVCVEKQDVADHIVDIAKAEFPDVSLYVRSYDRRHTLDLIAKGVDFELRETYESALLFGRRALQGLGIDTDRAKAVENRVRERDLARLALQQAGGLLAGGPMIRPHPQPEPLSRPEREGKPLNPEAEEIIRRKTSAPC